MLLQKKKQTNKSPLNSHEVNVRIYSPQVRSSLLLSNGLLGMMLCIRHNIVYILLHSGPACSVTHITLIYYLLIILWRWSFFQYKIPYTSSCDSCTRRSYCVCMLLEAEMTTALIFLIHFGGGSATNVGKFLHTDIHEY